MWVREAAVAGRFYLGDAEQLRRQVRVALEARPATRGPIPKALIVPHAGYAYSAQVAATGYAAIGQRGRFIDRVILLGTCHSAGVTGLAATTASAFRTPLGSVAIDVHAVGEAFRLPGVSIRDDAHRDDHALEVQLPFLQVVLEDFSIVPFLVGRADARAVAGLLDAFWDGESTLIVVSSDLSHYHDREEARRRDQATADAIEALDGEALDPRCACGRDAIAGLLLAARDHGLNCRALDLRNSGDTAGRRDRVVGYGAFILSS